MAEAAPAHVKIAIVGSGPGGLSAAVTAAQMGVPHLLLEQTDHFSDTIFKYQKRKKVMAHPMKLPLLGQMPFEESLRETILDNWNRVARETNVQVRFRSEVRAIEGQAGAFRLALSTGETVTAEQVVLAIGLQGNVRKLGIEGAEREWVIYQLDDPEAFTNKRITVVGAGDAGIENALALCNTNSVSIVNNNPDFSRAKPGNMADAERAVRAGLLTAYHASKPARIEDHEIVLDTPKGEERIPVDLVIARIGAIAPRKFVESCGIKFPNADPASIPELSETYESNIRGLYIIGALGGYTLIKQAMNQGHEVVARLAGKPCAPADEELLKQRFAAAFPGWSVNESLAYIRDRVPILNGLTTLQLRDAVLDCNIQRFKPTEEVFKAGDYTNSLWNVAEGAAAVELGPTTSVRIGAGEFFGELGLRSGRRRTATVRAAEPSVMVEVSIPAMRKLETSVSAVRQELDRVAVRRRIHTTLGRGRPIDELEELIAASDLRKYKALEVIIKEGDPVDALYILHHGTAQVSRLEDGHANVLTFINAGSLFGERGFLDGDVRRAATISATVASEVVRIDADAVRAALQRMPHLREVFNAAVETQMNQNLRATLAQATHVGPANDVTAIANFLIAKGVGEATNVFIIDESICTRCGNCESACAATHGGVSRVSRELGNSAEGILLPLACRHCETPHCMSHCPVDAISRMPSGEVIIDPGICIGCKACMNDCPYGVISMHEVAPANYGRGNWLTKMLATVGLAHTHNGEYHGDGSAKKAMKCDLCRNTGGIPSCVTACPTGAAMRVEPESYLTWLREGRSLS
jgi:thioredoxin reductase/CRP-like cAMP-binding protein/Fe-S-cluster-containing dehydrogenase component